MRGSGWAPGRPSPAPSPPCACQRPRTPPHCFGSAAATGHLDKKLPSARPVGAAPGAVRDGGRRCRGKGGGGGRARARGACERPKRGVKVPRVCPGRRAPLAEGGRGCWRRGRQTGRAARSCSSPAGVPGRRAKPPHSPPLPPAPAGALPPAAQEVAGLLWKQHPALLRASSPPPRPGAGSPSDSPPRPRPCVWERTVARPKTKPQ